MADPNDGGIPRVGMYRRLSFWVSVTLIATLAWLLLSALARDAVKAERAGVRQMLNQVHAAMLVKEASLQLPHQNEETQQLSGANPIDWMKLGYANYSDSCGPTGQPVAGAWCFQKRATGGGLLVYRARSLKTINGQPADAGGLFRWGVVVEQRAGQPDRLRLKRWWPKQQQ